MLEIAIMVEGQNGLNWPRWQQLALSVEQLGFSGLYRSDHYTNASPPDKDSLELWVSLTWLATNSSRIKFGPLVSPMSFRNPTMTARMASALDDLSDGRFILGLGAGWQEREHANYGWDLLDVPGRFKRLEEGIQVIIKLLHSDEPCSYSGSFFQLNEAVLLPRPQREGGPPILIGGNGPKRTLPLAARYAGEWNSIYLTPSQFAERNKQLDELIISAGRKVEDVRRSMMIGCIHGADQSEVEEKVFTRSKGARTADDYRNLGLVVGTGDEIVGQLHQYEAAGLEKAMLQWLDLDDLKGLELMAEKVLV
ncbi:MAG: LLM class F420-dependent oxidoreductase [Anaerolineae bacterium]|nr:MAG: LLM class F420-dependent oxidoreductase [Anaerolineae bacterium]